MNLEQEGVYNWKEDGLIETDYLKNIINRALSYAKTGFPIHLRGGAGTGKTSLAMQIAKYLGRPTIIIFGNDDVGAAELIGGYFGFRKRVVVDNFIGSVLKTEEDYNKHWVDSRITTACRNGYTLIYDEFTRTRPEANNILLSILEERILDFASPRVGEKYLAVHPDFRAIFTSNPAEYVGVHKSQDALLDRMITLDLDFFDEATEVAIVMAKSGLGKPEALKIVSLLRKLRACGDFQANPTIRAGIMIGKIIKAQNIRHRAGIIQTCYDVLASDVEGITSQEQREKFANFLEVSLN